MRGGDCLPVDNTFIFSNFQFLTSILFKFRRCFLTILLTSLTLLPSLAENFNHFGKLDFVVTVVLKNFAAFDLFRQVVFKEILSENRGIPRRNANLHSLTR